MLRTKKGASREYGLSGIGLCGNCAQCSAGISCISAGEKEETSEHQLPSIVSLLACIALHCIALHAPMVGFCARFNLFSRHSSAAFPASQISILTLLSVCVNRKCVSSDREGFSSLFGRAFASCACCCSVGVWQKGTGGKAKVGAALTPIKQSSTLGRFGLLDSTHS